MYTTENGHVIYTTQPTATVSVPAIMAGSNTVTQQHQVRHADIYILPFSRQILNQDCQIFLKIF
jgi:hypothetical protein